MPKERRCICKHDEESHLFDGSESLCVVKGCNCSSFFLWAVTFCDPLGVSHRVHDIAKFVRDNEGGKFDASDVLLRATESFYTNPLRHNKSGQYSRAEQGLSQVACGRVEHWKGWTLLIAPKTYNL